MAEALLLSLWPAALLSWIGWLFFLLRFLRSSGRVRALLPVAGSCVMLAGLALGLRATQFRNLDDETSFLVTAWSIATRGRASGASEWIWSGASFQPLAEAPSFRPALFPSLLALSGLITGFLPGLGFFLSRLGCAFLAGLLVYSIPAARARSRALLGALAGAAAIGGALRFGIADSGGYDSLAAVFFLASLLFWERRGKDSGLLALLSALCLAHTRSEGLLLFLLLLIELRPAALRAAFLLLAAAPLLLQRIYYPWHVDVPKGGLLFSLAAIPANLGDFFSVFFLQPGPLLVFSWLGGLFLLRGICVLWKELRPFCLYSLLLLIFLLGFHAGAAGEALQARLYFPFFLLFGVLGVFRRLAQASGLAGFAGRFAIALAALLAPFSAWPEARRLHPVAEELAALRPVLESAGRGTLFVYRSPGMIAGFRKGAVMPWRYLRDEAVLTALADEVWWIEAIPVVSPATRRPSWVDWRKPTKILPLGGMRSLALFSRNGLPP